MANINTSFHFNPNPSTVYCGCGCGDVHGIVPSGLPTPLHGSGLSRNAYMVYTGVLTHADALRNTLANIDRMLANTTDANYVRLLNNAASVAVLLWGSNPSNLDSIPYDL